MTNETGRESLPEKQQKYNERIKRWMTFTGGLALSALTIYIFYRFDPLEMF